jgi:uncharacterized damage-inducible protein DinB
MDPRVVALADILRLNTRLFRNCLDGLTDEQAGARPSATTNSAAFIAAHVADSRYFLLKVLGDERPSPLAPYLGKARGIDDVKQCPPLAETREAWTAASHALRDRLAVLTAAELDTAVSMKFFPAEQTVLGILTFLVQHDSYHVGQLALLRKYAGLPAMQYT